jgi:hypothetical protein
MLILLRYCVLCPVYVSAGQTKAGVRLVSESGAKWKMDGVGMPSIFASDDVLVCLRPAVKGLSVQQVL